MKSLNKDTFLEIAMKLPAPSIFNLCVTTPDFRSNCKRWEDDLYRKLIARDGGAIYSGKSVKDSYIKNFLVLGQPYYLEILDQIQGSFGCTYRLSDMAVIKNRSLHRDLSSKYARFYLGGEHNPFSDRELTVSDFEPGRRYWVYGYFIKGSGSRLFVANSKEDAINKIFLPKVQKEQLQGKYSLGCIEFEDKIYVIQEIFLN